MPSQSRYIALLLSALAAAPALGAQLKCSAQALTSSGLPPIFSAQILSLTASPIKASTNATDNDVCLVTVATTHPGNGDRINNFVALPLNNWNGIFQGIGGGGFLAGKDYDALNQTLLGYATAWTDAGLGRSDIHDASAWALLSPGNVNQTALLNFGFRALHELAVIGKAVTHSFYGEEARHSYWNGCSQGGRQGLAIAQHFQEDYDGILADAPAVQWNDLTPAQQWPFVVQNNEGYAPPPCEFSAANRAVIAACDGLDGLVDGIISAPALCNFSAQSLVGKTYACIEEGSNRTTNRTFNRSFATVTDKIWEGARTPGGEFLWYGIPKGAHFSTLAGNLPNESTAQPWPIADSWWRGFLAKDLDFNTSSVTYQDFANAFLQGHLQYDSVIGTASPDLRPFKARGGKMITWQGLADSVVNPQGTMLYYQKVRALDPKVADFYRQFFSPGVGHCKGGTGVQPTYALGQLRAWVENGTAPTSLEAASRYPVNPSSNFKSNGTAARRMDLCPWPQVSRYQGVGDPAVASSWTCANGTGWVEFPGPGPRSYSCIGGPGWYGSAV